jgi:hypothetical protein
MRALAKANDNEPRGLEVEVAERADAPGNWTVEAVDTGSEGEVYQALFSGPKAKDRAYAYAMREYGVEGEVTET